jgi:monovalent cation:H+ antiporter-2, CPA2 family
MTLFVTHNFLEDMALVMCIAALTTVICQWLRQPLLMGYLVAGMIVGPNVPGVYADPGRIELVSEIGVILLIFSIGLEFNVRRLIRLAPTAGLIALLQVVAMIWLGDRVGRMLGWTPWQSLVTGAILSISGAVILAKAFEEVRVEPKVRELVFGVVLCEDVIAILLLAIMITLAHGGAVSLHGLSTSVGLLGLFFLLLTAIGLLTVPYLVRGVARLDRPETLLITSLGLCFAFAMIAARAGYSVALGAFLAGSLVGESGHGTHVEELITPVRNVFGAIFFVSVGMLIDPRVLVKYWPAILVLSAAVIVGKIISVSLASMLVGESTDTAVKAGFAMAQIGVFSFLIAEVGTSGNPKDRFLYSLAVSVSAITAFLSPSMIRASNPAADWIGRHLPAPVQDAVSQYVGWLGRIRKSEEPETEADNPVE